MFKNLLLYRIAPDWQAQLDDAADRLARNPFAECSPSQAQSAGWVPPRGEAHAPLLEAVAGQWLARLLVERKQVPASVIARHVDQLAERIEAETGRKPGRKQRQELKDQALLALLPQAFARRGGVGVWIAPQTRLLAIDAGSQAAADELLSLLTEALPGFAARPINTAQSPAAAMADWLLHSAAPSPFTIDRDCELKAEQGEKPAVRYARHALDLDEIRAHIQQGKRPTRLALTWSGRVSLVLTDGLQLKRIAFLDGVYPPRADGADGADFNADAAIATGELAPLIDDLLAALGGEADAQFNQVSGEADAQFKQVSGAGTPPFDLQPNAKADPATPPF